MFKNSRENKGFIVDMMKKAFAMVLLLLSLWFPTTASCQDHRHPAAHKGYDDNAKTTYSENDVKAFVYQWFAGFDHQVDISFFKKHLPPGKLDMYFPDFPISRLSDFERWYNGVCDNIQWNAHHLSNLNVSGDEKDGFFISLDVNWKAKTYSGESYDMNVHQDWTVKVDKGRNFVIEKHRARVMDK